MGNVVGAGGVGAVWSTNRQFLLVAPTGNDTNDCSAAHPCRQIRKGLTLVQPGDRIFVADGTYLGFTAQSLSGNATNPITIKAQGTNAYVFATTDRPDNRDNILLSFCQWLIVDGLNSTNAPRAGMRIDQCAHITVRNGHFGSNTTWGIFTDFSDDLLIENNECHHSVQQHGIYHSNSGDRPTIRGNYCHDNGAIGIHMNGDFSQGGDGLISGAVVENNIIVNNGTLGGAGINMDGVQDSIVRNNLLYNNHASGMAMFQIDGAQGPSSNQVLNNTIDMGPTTATTTSRWALLISQTAGPITVRNNILYQRNVNRGGIDYVTPADAANTDSDYNDFGGVCFVTTNDGSSRVSLATWQAGGHEPHSSCIDITNLVVSAFNHYHLKTNSPAIDAGQTLVTVPTDLELNARPAGPASDIGAYEFGAMFTPPNVFASIEGPNVCVSFPTLVGKIYELQRADDLNIGGWTTITNNMRGGELLSIPDPNAALLPKRFYRVCISP